MKRLLLLITLVVLVGGAMWLGKTFPAANSTLVDLDLLWVRVPNLQVWQLMLLSLGVGALAGSLLMGLFWLRGWVVGRRYRKAIKRLESEIHQLRSLPLAREGDTDTAKALPAGRTLPFGRRKKKALAPEQGKPLTSQEGKPLVSDKGNPVTSDKGKPLTSDKGKPLAEGKA